MADLQMLELPIAGMDCTECTQHVQRAIAALPGVQSVNVLLAAEKVVIRLDPTQVDVPAIRSTVERAGYAVPTSASVSSGPQTLEILVVLFQKENNEA